MARISGIETEKVGPGFSAGPSEQQTSDLDPPFKGGGRRADLPADYQARQTADQDYNQNLERVRRQDREALGQMHGKLDATPWVQGGKGRNAGG